MSKITTECDRVTDHVLHPTVRSSLVVGVEVVEVVEEVEEMVIHDTLDVMSVFQLCFNASIRVAACLQLSNIKTSLSFLLQIG